MKYVAAMAAERTNLLAIADAPEFEGPVVAAAGELAAIGRERDGCDPVSMAIEGSNQ
jgi:hypothetical protein